ncbi:MULTISPECIES: AraC family transcriptional regulator [Pseudomonas]|uniref:HTH araC/xylS-type domain-containing protein n=2 Tax=Pseudomonadaceae TaxID=135621 RepID=A0A0D0JXM3_9PSED|nr:MULTISPECIES: AraC family transcriptional regulator [Pseudomonas]KIP89680.1 hypothetical protein RU08_23800 [Pseudomonas fulva]MCW2290735.1 AraC-like DNA-binding protein [Pseudomonas sp. BIGb0408]NYH74692.1 AraC-like DNA-binding protein [Pseudomonas flavescens]
MAINHYYADRPLNDVFASFADEELDVRLIEMDGEHDLYVQADSHPSLTLAYYEQGGGWRQFADTPAMDLRNDTCCLYHSSVSVRGEGLLPAGSRLRGVNISFAPQILQRLRVGEWLFDSAGPWERACSSDGLARLVQFPAPHVLRRIGLEMLDCRLEGLARDILMRAKAFEMLAEMLGYLQENLRPSVLGGRDRLRLERAHQHLREALERPWTLESLAAEVQLNVRKLKDGFRQLYGKGVYAELQDLRMQHAALCLRQGQRVGDVAMAVGYSNPSHFAKVFRRHHGLAPRAYSRQVGVAEAS